MTKPSKREALAVLTIKRLGSLCDDFDLERVGLRRKQDFVDLLARSKNASFAKILVMLRPDELKAICRAADLDDAGKVKAELAARILGTAPPSHTPSSTQESTSAASTGARERRSDLNSGILSHRRAPARTTREGPSGSAAAELATPPQPKGKQDDQRRAAHHLGPTGPAGRMMNDLRKLEDSLWEAADRLRANSKLNATEYSMPVLGLIFLRHATNRFDRVHEQIKKRLPSRGGKARAVAAGDFASEGAIFLPEEARYDTIAGLPEDQDIGKAIKEAMEAVEAQVPDLLKGVLPKEYPKFDPGLLRDLVRVFNSDELRKATNDDLFGRIYASTVRPDHWHRRLMTPCANFMLELRGVPSKYAPGNTQLRKRCDLSQRHSFFVQSSIQHLHMEAG